MIPASSFMQHNLPENFPFSCENKSGDNRKNTNFNSRRGCLRRCPVGPGIVVNAIVAGKGVVTVEVTGTGVDDFDEGRVAFVAGVIVIFSGSPSSTRTLLFAADEGFSTLMENDRVAVPEEVWKATIARPSRSVVTRA